MGHRGEKQESWSGAKEERLRQLVVIEKLSYRDAAERLGVTRDAASSKGKKMGIRNGSGRKNDGNKTPRRVHHGEIQLRSTQPIIPLPAPRSVVTVLPKRDPDGELFTTLTISHETCKWPIGDLPDIHYCGHTPKHNAVYCPIHAAASAAPRQPAKPQFGPPEMTRIFGGGG